MSPKQVKITSGWPASHIASSMRPIGITQTGQPGAVHQFDVVGQQVFDAVPVNGVGVPAAHLHELEVFGAAGPGQVLDGDQQFAGRGRVTEFVNEFHMRSSLQTMADESKASISVV